MMDQLMGEVASTFKLASPPAYRTKPVYVSLLWNI